MAREQRTKLFNMQLNREEEDRLRRVAEHYNLGLAQVVRTLVARAARGLGRRQSPADRADAAWLKAEAAFLQTGVAETLGRIVVNAEAVGTTVRWLDRASAGARECGETEVYAAVRRLREEVSDLRDL